jgi:hypothetical protein
MKMCWRRFQEIVRNNQCRAKIVKTLYNVKIYVGEDGVQWVTNFLFRDYSNINGCRAINEVPMMEEDVAHK